jgi:hypothetical protein
LTFFSYLYQQLFCYKNTGGFGQGSGCPIGSGKAHLRVLIYYTTPGGQGTAANGKRENNWSTGPFNNSGATAAQNECGWDQDLHGPWYVNTNAISADADAYPELLP